MRFITPAFYLNLIFLASCASPTKEKQVIPSAEDGPHWEALPRITKAHLRGLDMASDAVIWASGTEGTVLKSLDSGKTWTAMQIPNCESLDFRDVEAFDENRAAVMSSGDGVRMFYTEDGGINWILAFEDTNKKVFFDGMDFNGDLGLAYGDPLNGKFDMLQSKDGGRSWVRYDKRSMPECLEKEAGFAASGTGIILGQSAMWLATGGGAEARIIKSDAEHSWRPITSPLKSEDGAGIFSMAFLNDEIGIVVGGNYVDSTNKSFNAAYTSDGGESWHASESNPNGYRSCVAINSLGLSVATGRTGADFSRDFGQHWESLSTQGYFSCVIGPDYIVGVGRNGKIGRMAVDLSGLLSYANETSAP
jgi:photosystem II stability/assembly factor-like uncharacterized protein